VRLGLPGLVDGNAGSPAPARIGHDLRLRGNARAQRVAGVERLPVDVLTTLGGDWREAREQLRTVLGRGRVVAVDRTGDPRVRAVLERMPGVVALDRPGLSVAEALGEGLEHLEQDEVLVLPEGGLLLPGALPALRHALHRHGGPALALGDQVLLDSRGAVPLGVLAAPRLGPSAGPSVLELLGPDLPPILVSRTLLQPARPALGGPTPLHLWLRSSPAARAVQVLPLWTAGRTRPLHRRVPHPPQAPLSVLPEDAGLYILVDDGDDGALGQTLARVPSGARLAILRPGATADQAALLGLGACVGGYGDLPEHDAGPWHLRLTSDPGWRAPPLHEPALLRELPLDLPSAVRLVAAALGWPEPVRRRATGRARPSTLVMLAQDARRAMLQGDRSLALTLCRALSGATGRWPGAERMLTDASLDRTA